MKLRGSRGDLRGVGRGKEGGRNDVNNMAH